MTLNYACVFGPDQARRLRRSRGIADARAARRDLPRARTRTRSRRPARRLERVQGDERPARDRRERLHAPTRSRPQPTSRPVRERDPVRLVGHDSTDRRAGAAHRRRGLRRVPRRARARRAWATTCMRSSATSRGPQARGVAAPPTRDLRPGGRAAVAELVASRQAGTLLPLRLDRDAGRVPHVARERVHVAAAETLGRALVEAGCRRLVALGTCFEYAPSERPLSEASPSVRRRRTRGRRSRPRAARTYLRGDGDESRVGASLLPLRALRGHAQARPGRDARAARGPRGADDGRGAGPRLPPRRRRRARARRRSPRATSSGPSTSLRDAP